ncbi:MAG: CHAT domain-containing protein [Caldilineaceae bacterium]|nr:CHAT domain-containing protein [Caldilineaceae bacterium]
MAITLDELYQFCEKEVVLLPEDAPLDEAIWRFFDRGYEESSAWLIVQLNDGGYRAIRFDALARLLIESEPSVLYAPLAELPLPAVDRIVSIDDGESIDELNHWLDAHPNATLVVVDGERCAGLMTNPLIPKGIDEPTLRQALLQVRPLEAMSSSGGDEPAPPVQSVELHTDIDFPEHIRPHEEQPLIVKLTPQIPAESRADEIVRMEFEDPFVPEPVEVSVHAPDFVERNDTWTRTMQVYSFTESSPAVFLLKAAVEGIFTIGVDFRHRQRLIGSARFEVTVSQQPPPPQSLSRSIPNEEREKIAPAEDAAPGLALIISQSPPPPADVELRVHLSADNGLSFELHSPLPQLGLDRQKVGEVPLNAAPQRFLRGILTEMSRLARNRADNPAQIIRQIEGIGENLFLDLFPAALQTVYWTLCDLRDQGVIRSLLITSDEPWIPWELIKPYDANSDRSDDFLAGGWQLCRWLAGPGPVDQIRVLAARLIAPDLDLDFVKKEKSYFASMAHWGVDIGASPLQRLEEVQLVTEEGGIQLLHFATHGNFGDGNPDESVIRLADQAELYPRDLRGSRVRGLRQSRPMVFLNACHTAQIDFALTGLGGWAERLLVDVCASAFIGTLWEVNDELAAEFSGAFYHTLWQGSTLGEAFQFARNHVRRLQPANSTWLAYTLYGDPNVKVYWGN